jgi:hypothetical protein
MTCVGVAAVPGDVDAARRAAGIRLGRGPDEEREEKDADEE